MWKIIFAIVFSVFLASAGCSPSTSSKSGSSDPGGGGGGGGGTGGGPTAEDPTEDLEVGTPLYFSLGSQWDAVGTSDAYKEEKTCTTAVNASLGSVTDCEISIPEAQLYYSNLIFRYGTKTALTCPIVYFLPYYYRRQSTNANILNDETATDCTKSNKECFGGAATQIVPEFPKNTGIIVETKVSPSATSKLKSEFTTKHYRGYKVNYLVTNDITDSTTPIPAGAVNSMLGSWQDYQVLCVDYWGEVLHTINITISDENTEDTLGGPQDTYTDWP